MLFATIMEPWETFIGRAMKQPCIWMKLSMKKIPLDIEPKGWENNANKVTLVDLEQRVQYRIEMCFSSQRHGNMYMSKKISHVHEKI